MEQEYEIIGGVKYKMSPTNFFHYNASDNLTETIKSEARAHGYKVVQDVTLLPPGTAIKVFPDVAVFKSPVHYNKRGAIRDIPLFIAEVVSPSTRPKDFSEKKDLYEELGVWDYWIVDPYGEYVMTYHLDPISHTYGKAIVHQYDDEEESETGEALRLAIEGDFSVLIDMADLFAVDGELVD